MRRFTRLPIAVVLIAAALGCAKAAEDLSSAFNEPASASCVASPTAQCVLLLATQIVLSAERKEDARRYLPRIAAAQARAGFRADAEATIEHALRHLDQVEHRGYSVLDEIADVLGGLGRFDDALRLADAGSKYERSAILTTVAKHRARAAGTADGLALLQPLPPSERHLAVRRLAWTMRYAALERGEEGLLIEALRLVEGQEIRPAFTTGIHHIAVFPPALFILAHAQAETGRLGMAWDLAQSIRHKWERKAALSHLALVEVRAGGISACLRRLIAMDDAPLRSEILRQTLEGLAGAGVLESLLKWGIDDGMPVRPPRIAAAAAADLAEALGMARAMTDARDRAVALGIIAAVQAQSGELSDALDTARSVTDPESRYFAFRIVARLASAAGRNAETKAAYDEAYAVAKAFDGKPDRPGLRDRRLSPVAIGMAGAGFVTDALDVVASMEGNLSNGAFGVDGRVANADSERRYALYAIAEAQAKLGAVPEAIATARGIKREGEILGLEVGIVASGLAAEGRIAEAISVVRSEVQNSHWRNGTLLAIAEKLTASGEPGRALQVAAAMADDDEKVSALAAIAKVQVQAGFSADANATYVEALRVTRGLRYVSQCVLSLLRIASSMESR